MEPFDIKKSQVAAWLLSHDDVVNHFVTQIMQRGMIVYDKETKLWQGNPTFIKDHKERASQTVIGRPSIMSNKEIIREMILRCPLYPARSTEIVHWLAAERKRSARTIWTYWRNIQKELTTKNGKWVLKTENQVQHDIAVEGQNQPSNSSNHCQKVSKPDSEADKSTNSSVHNNFSAAGVAVLKCKNDEAIEKKTSVEPKPTNKPLNPTTSTEGMIPRFRPDGRLTYEPAKPPVRDPLVNPDGTPNMEALLAKIRQDRAADEAKKKAEKEAWLQEQREQDRRSLEADRAARANPRPAGAPACRCTICLNEWWLAQDTPEDAEGHVICPHCGNSTDGAEPCVVVDVPRVEVEEAAPEGSPEHQKLVGELAVKCTCTPKSERPCAGLLAGGLCDDLHLDGPEAREEDGEQPSVR
jgi:hypothetical protein